MSSSASCWLAERFDLLKTSLGESHAAAIAVLEMNGIGELELDEAVAQCPACGSRALAHGVNELENGDEDVGKYGDIEGVDMARVPSPLAQVRTLRSRAVLADRSQSRRYAGELAQRRTRVFSVFRDLEAERNAELLQYADYDDTEMDSDEP